MGKRYISMKDIRTYLTDYSSHGYVHELWKDQLKKDNRPTKDTYTYDHDNARAYNRTRPTAYTGNPPCERDLHLVGGFTDPDIYCAFDTNAETAINDLKDALDGLYEWLYYYWRYSGGIVRTVSKDFSGYFADEVFKPNSQVSFETSRLLFHKVREVSKMLDDYKSSAKQEQQNRETAKKSFVAHWNWWNKHKDWEEKIDAYNKHKTYVRQKEAEKQRSAYANDYHVQVKEPEYAPYAPYPGDEPTPADEAEIEIPKSIELPKAIGEKTLGDVLVPKEIKEKAKGYTPSGTSTTGKTATSGEPNDLRQWGQWWGPRGTLGRTIRDAVFNVAIAYEEGLFASAPTGDQAGKEKGSAGWKWGRIGGLCDDCTGGVATGGLLGAVLEFCDNNDNDARMLDIIAQAFEDADKAGISRPSSYDDLSKLLNANEVNLEKREIPTIDVIEVQGVQPSTGYAQDPVNVATGALTEVETDIRFAGSAESFKVVRTYNAGDRNGGVFGVGWFSVLDEYLEVSPSDVAWRRADGALVHFGENPASTGTSEEIEADSRPYWLTHSDIPIVFGNSGEMGIETDKVFCVSDNAGAVRVFDRDGVLLGFAGAVPSDSVLCQRDEQGRIERLVHASGRHVVCEYNAENLVSRLYASNECEVVYLYIDNHLVSVASPLGVREYAWNEEIGILERTTDESGVVLMDNTFDDEGRVSRQKTPDGRTVEFVYLPSGVTLVCDADDDSDSVRVDRWVSDKDTRLVGVVDSHGSQMSISRDRFGNPVNVNDREDHETLRVFDSRSHLSLQVTPEGVRTAFEWDEWDRCTRITREIPSSNSAIARSVSNEAISSSSSSVVEETIFTYSDPDQTNGFVVRTPVSVTDSEGVTYTFEHDEAGRVATMSVGSRYRLAFAYDENTGDLTSITNALGQTVSFTYDATGNIISSTSPSGALTRFEWDNAGHAVKRIDPDGAVYESVYEHDRLVSYVAPDGGTTTYTYGENGKVVSITDPLGRVTQLTHDDQGNTAAITTPDGNTWQTLHDSMSRLTKILTPTGDEWAYGYTANGNLESITSPAGLISTVTKALFNGGTQFEGATSAPESADSEQSLPSPSLREASATKQSQHGGIIYDALGRPVKILSPDGDILETHVYDKAGRLIEVLDAEAGLTRYEYNELGIVSRIINPDETVTEFTYDEAARLVRKSYSSAEFEDYSYDADGRVIAVVNHDGDEETFTYDACGRVTSHTTPQGDTSAYSYDMCGRTTSVTDGLHGTRTFAYDLAGQLVSATDANGNTTTYTYSANGKIESVTAPDGGITRFEYDCYGNMTKKTDPLGRSETRTYNSIGNLLSLTRADNTGLKYEYDLTGRLLEIANHKGESLARYDYDTAARTITVADSLANTEHRIVFDRLGRLISKTTGDTTIAYTYDKSGSRESMSIICQGDDEPITITYGYDSAGELAEVTHSTFGILNPSSRGTGGTSDTAISYDKNGRIARIVTDASDVSYEYDTAGQLAVLADNHTGENTVYAYDECGRLASITDSEGETRFTYNQAGEIVSRVMPDGTAIMYAYDACGRRVSETLNDASVRRFEWDNLGYLARVTSSSLGGDATEEVSLSHDIFGDLATLTSEEETTQFVWDTDADVPALLKAGENDVFIALGHTAYGTPRVNTGWLSHGWREARPTNPANPWGLPPEIASSALGGLPRNDGMMSPWTVLLGGSVSVFGMELMGARTYDPVTHGFLSLDPLPPMTGMPYANNLYEYAGNNPLSLLDPLGLHALTDVELKEFAEPPSAWNNFFSWDTLVGVAAMAVGGILVATGVGGPLGLGLMSFGADVVIQKVTGGEVDWTDAAVSGVFGMIGGPAALGAKAFKTINVLKKVDKVVSNPTLRKTISGAVEGGGEELTKQVLNDPRKLTTAEGWKEVAKSTVTGGAGGAKAGVKTKIKGTPDTKKYDHLDDLKNGRKYNALAKNGRTKARNMPHNTDTQKAAQNKEYSKVRKAERVVSARKDKAWDIAKDTGKSVGKEFAKDYNDYAVEQKTGHVRGKREKAAADLAVDTFVDFVSGDEDPLVTLVDNVVDTGADHVTDKIFQ